MLDLLQVNVGNDDRGRDDALFGDGGNGLFVLVPEVDDAVLLTEGVADVRKGAFSDFFQFQRLGKRLRQLVENGQPVVFFGE